MRIPDVIKEVSRKLRGNMTESEVVLWSFLKGKKLGVRFMRQKPIYVFSEDSGLDRYIIPDFCCYDSKLIFEIDGNVHNIKEVYELDLYKEKLLKNMGFKIIRIKNQDIKTNINDVLKIINSNL